MVIRISSQIFFHPALFILVNASIKLLVVPM